SGLEGAACPRSASIRWWAAFRHLNQASCGCAIKVARAYRFRSSFHGPRRLVRLPAAFDALSNRDYRLLWLGALASLTSASMRQIANGYLAYSLTGSAAVLAIVVLAQSLPSFFLSMFGGVIADRVKKRQLLLLTQSFIFFDS